MIHIPVISYKNKLLANVTKKFYYIELVCSVPIRN